MPTQCQLIRRLCSNLARYRSERKIHDPSAVLHFSIVDRSQNANNAGRKLAGIAALLIRVCTVRRPRKIEASVAITSQDRQAFIR